MELMLAIIAAIAVIGLIVMGLVIVIVSKKERESLHQLIKSRDLTEYISVTDEPEEEEEREVEIDITDIPILTDESRE
jgi:FtsZ-interacting cell division protein ZipA